MASNPNTISAVSEAKFKHLKESTLKALRVVHKDGDLKYSSGAIHRATGIPAFIVQHWRLEAGIPNLPAGKCRPSPGVGQILD